MSDAPRPHFDMLIRYGLSPEALRAAVQGDQAVRAEAEAELAALAGVHDDRDVIAKEYSAALRAALAGLAPPLPVVNNSARIGGFTLSDDGKQLNIISPDGTSVPLMVDPP